MGMLFDLQQEFNVPLQSHLAESLAEIEWVRRLCPTCKTYAGAYDRFGLFGGEIPTIMAHCVWSDEDEIAMMREKNVYIAHCPQSNMNLSSGIAPVRRFLNNDISVGLGSDVAGGCHTSIFKAMAAAIQVSKLHYCLVDQQELPLSVTEAFYLGTLGGGSFFGNVGSFNAGYEFDAIVIDDADIYAPFPLTIEERLARVIYFSDDRHIQEKYVRGQCVKSE
jgi:guanine deaminase